MRKALAVITIVVTCVASGLAREKKNIEPTDIRLTDRAIRADVSRLTLLTAVFDESIPRVCDDNFRFCTAGCRADDGACAAACVADLKECIKSIHIVENVARLEPETGAPVSSCQITQAHLQSETLDLR